MKTTEDEFKGLCDRARNESLETGGKASVVEYGEKKTVMEREVGEYTFLGVDSPRIREGVKKQCAKSSPPINPPQVITVFVVYEDGALVTADDDKIGELF